MRGKNEMLIMTFVIQSGSGKRVADYSKLYFTEQRNGSYFGGHR